MLFRSTGRREHVRVITLDSLELERVDFIKLDVEEMELDVLKGADVTLDRCRPIMQIEWLRKDSGALPKYIRQALDYRVYVHNMNLLCIPAERHSNVVVQAPEWTPDALAAPETQA